MTKFHKLRLNKTVRRKTKENLVDAVSALIPFAFLYPCIELPQNGRLFGFAMYLVFGSGWAIYSVLGRLHRRAVRAALEDEPDVKVVSKSGLQLFALQLLSIMGFVAVVGVSVTSIHAAVTNSLAPLWHRACVVLIANYFGWSLLWAVRALFDFVRELFRRPIASAAPLAPIAAPAVTPQAVPTVVQNVAPPVAATLSAGQGKPTP